MKLTRPKVMKGDTVKKTTGCGNLYITVNTDGNGSGPLEVFARLGKAGGCTNCQNEALTRVITVGLRYGAPVEELVKELRGLGCPNPIWEEGVMNKSCPDAIAQVLERYIDDKDVS